MEENKGGKTKTKKETMKEKTAAWRKPLTVQEREAQGEEGEEEEQKEADPLVHPEEKRHYAKARKFAKMLKKGQLPEEIKLMYTEAAQKSESPRLFQTQLINKLFQKNKKNEWVMSTDNPEFASWKQSYDKKFSTAKSVGRWPATHGNVMADIPWQQRGHEGGSQCGRHIRRKWLVVLQAGGDRKNKGAAGQDGDFRRICPTFSG